jgi:hypothetical protein
VLKDVNNPGTVAVGGSIRKKQNKNFDLVMGDIQKRRKKDKNVKMSDRMMYVDKTRAIGVVMGEKEIKDAKVRFKPSTSTISWYMVTRQHFLEKASEGAEQGSAGDGNYRPRLGCLLQEGAHCVIAQQCSLGSLSWMFTTRRCAWRAAGSDMGCYCISMHSALQCSGHYGWLRTLLN